MEADRKTAPLVVIVGHTASGKSAVAMKLAKKFNGEIIAADSRTIYRGMDVGTAKPSLEDRQSIKHHLIDLFAPDKPITVARYKNLADRAIIDILKRGKLPILVGGSGLYVDAIIYDFKFNGPAKPSLRHELNTLSAEELRSRIEGQGLIMPRNYKNKRHLVRRLEAGNQIHQDKVLRDNTLIIGLRTSSEELKKAITKRTEAMLNNGLEKEVKQLSAKYDWELESLRTIGYQEFKSYLSGEQDITATKDAIIKETIHYAKRQQTWFRRNKDIHWPEKQIQIVDLVTTFLNK